MSRNINVQSQFTIANAFFVFHRLHCFFSPPTFGTLMLTKQSFPNTCLSWTLSINVVISSGTVVEDRVTPMTAADLRPNIEPKLEEDSGRPQHLTCGLCDTRNGKCRRNNWLAWRAMNMMVMVGGVVVVAVSRSLRTALAPNVINIGLADAGYVWPTAVSAVSIAEESLGDMFGQRRVNCVCSFRRACSLRLRFEDILPDNRWPVLHGRHT